MPQLEPTASLSLTCVWVLGVLLIPSSPWAYRVRELAVREDVLSPVPPLAGPMDPLLYHHHRHHSLCYAGPHGR